MPNSPATVVDFPNGFPEFVEFDSSAWNPEFPTKNSRNDSDVDSVMGLWSLLDRAVRENDADKRFDRSFIQTKVNIVKLDELRSSSFDFDDCFGWDINQQITDRKSVSKRIDHDSRVTNQSPNSPSSPRKHRRRLSQNEMNEVIDEALKQTNQTTVECSPTKGSRNKSTTILRKKVVEGRHARFSTSRTSKNDVLAVNYEEKVTKSLYHQSLGELSNDDRTSKRTADLKISVSERKVTEVTDSISRRRHHQHRRGSIDAHLSYSSERTKSSCKSTTHKNCSDAAIPLCDLLGNPSRVKFNRRNSIAVIDKHEMSYSSERAKSSYRSTAHKNSNDAIPLCDLLGNPSKVQTSRRNSIAVLDQHEISCDLLGNPNKVKTSRRNSITVMDQHEFSCNLLGNPSKVKTSRRNSLAVMDQHEISKGKRREKKHGDKDERRSSSHRESLVKSHNNLSRSERIDDNNKKSLLTSTSLHPYQAPRPHRRRSLDYIKSDNSNTQQFKIKR